MGRVQLITNELLEDLRTKAKLSPRLRVNHNFHQRPEDTVHRFLNVLIKGTYVRPHRHVTPPKSETLILLEGELDLLIFDDAGTIGNRSRLSGTASEGQFRGADIAPGIWHTVLVLTDHAICFEIKPGPWIDGSNDKDFAPWAPEEGNWQVGSYLASLCGVTSCIL